MTAQKSYSFQDLTIIGRDRFKLDETWHCFTAEVTENGKGSQVKYGLSPQDENGEWLQEEIYGYVPLIK
ncbi:hypothetical protein ACFFF5_21165 [Lederbergia wuyishanensis]|uniref:Uncharacterized protein n=1 Tax=Lederbergia wuyishanensis TaxID=1347903 RepID=A0ABU0D754_9BACI|nr:hypothetical protein [Lederbergia wuyishanensis]MCJ8008927.1 hypothetical protein [Lederbergia wuyishanensis]MDQ0344253.1 hypothetical protein [Lederbergia wuyishanensis]